MATKRAYFNKNNIANYTSVESSAIALINHSNKFEKAVCAGQWEIFDNPNRRSEQKEMCGKCAIKACQYRVK
jgi:hypothetical protein